MNLEKIIPFVGKIVEIKVGGYLSTFGGMLLKVAPNLFVCFDASQNDEAPAFSINGGDTFVKISDICESDLTSHSFDSSNIEYIDNQMLAYFVSPEEDLKYVSEIVGDFFPNIFDQTFQTNVKKSSVNIKLCKECGNFSFLHFKCLKKNHHNPNRVACEDFKQHAV